MINKILPLCLGLLALAVLLRCSTTVTRSDGGPYAPHTPHQTGTVAYNPSGLKEIVDIRRKDALKSIYDACGSNRYKILRDEVRKKDPKTGDSIATFGAAKLEYIDYQCVD